MSNKRKKWSQQPTECRVDWVLVAFGRLTVQKLQCLLFRKESFIFCVHCYASNKTKKWSQQPTKCGVNQCTYGIGIWRAHVGQAKQTQKMKHCFFKVGDFGLWFWIFVFAHIQTANYLHIFAICCSASDKNKKELATNQLCVS